MQASSRLGTAAVHPEGDSGGLGRGSPMLSLSSPGAAAVHPEGDTNPPGLGSTVPQRYPSWRKRIYTLVNLIVHLRRSFLFW
jgi:hypothetical protein